MNKTKLAIAVLAGTAIRYAFECEQWRKAANEALEVLREGEKGLEEMGETIESLTNNNFYLQGIVEGSKAKPEVYQSGSGYLRETKPFASFVPYQELAKRYDDALHVFMLAATDETGGSDDEMDLDRAKDKLWEAFNEACRSDVAAVPLPGGKVTWPK